MARRDYWVTVCAECKLASCWHGEFMCDKAQNASTVEMKASALRELKREHSCHFSRQNLMRVCGHVREVKDA